METNTAIKRRSTQLAPDTDAEQASKRTKPTVDTPDLISSTLSCRVCLVQFKNQTRYRRHLVKTHKIKSQDISKFSDTHAKKKVTASFTLLSLL